MNIIGCYNIIESETKLLLVEHRGGQYGLPAGKLEVGESVFEGAEREAFEETGLEITVVGLVGIYQTPELRESNVINFAFISQVVSGNLSAREDHRSVGYFSRDEITTLSHRQRFRDSIITQIIQDYWRGQRFDLNVIQLLQDVSYPR